MEEINEFKDFVRRHPALKEEVSSGKSTWQSLYESWYLYGPEDRQWASYKEEKDDINETVKEEKVSTSEVADEKTEMSGPEMIAQAFEYLQKVDIDKVQKTMGTFQQFIQIFQTMQGGKGAAGSAAAGMLGSSAMPKQNYSGFFSQFDD